VGAKLRIAEVIEKVNREATGAPDASTVVERTCHLPCDLENFVNGGRLFWD